MASIQNRHQDVPDPHENLNLKFDDVASNSNHASISTPNGSIPSISSDADENPRAKLMAAIASKATNGATRGDDGASSEATVAEDPRAKLMAAIAKKKAADEAAKEDVSGGGAGVAEDPRAKLMAAIAKKKAADEAAKAESTDTDAAAAEDPRAKLMAAIAKKKAADEAAKEEASGGGAGVAEDPRAKLMAAIAKKKAADEAAKADDASESSAGKPDPRAALMAAMAKKKAADEAAKKDVEEKVSTAAAASTCLRDDPKYGKYFKMMKVGLPKEAVAHKMLSENTVSTQEEAFEILAMDPNGPPPAPKRASSAKEAPPMVLLKDDPKYQKYLKMIKVGLPKEAAAHKMVSENCCSTAEEALNILNMDPDGPSPDYLKSLVAPASQPAVAYKDHPVYSKYFKMIKVGLPADSVKAKMQIEGVDPAILDNDPDKMVPAEVTSAKKVPVKDHPTFSKYFKMLKTGVPLEAVRLKMRQEGADVTYIDKNPDDLVPLEVETEQMVPVGDHPVYSKYFRMLKVGLPPDAVKQKMRQEGANEAYLDKDPSELVPLAVKAPVTTMKKMMGPAVRKKKLYWKTVDHTRVGADSIWHRSEAESEAVEIDKEEFERLFVESVEAQKKAEASKPAQEQKKQKVNLIDAKRGQNAGIALARIKKSFDQVRKAIADMEEKEFSTEQLKSLGEYLPTDEESRILKAYQGDASLLGQAERYMMTMMGFVTAKKRLDCMVFKQQFKEKLHEIKGTVATIDKACDQVKGSTRMKKVLKCILKVGNQMNDGADNLGFSLDSLLKLQAAKAFDKKTSVLQYVIILIFRNDESSLYFPDDLDGVPEAARLMLDQVESDRVALNKGLDESFKNFADIQKDTSFDASEDSERNQAAMVTFLNKVVSSSCCIER